jgi:hypothetical protein
MSTVLCRAALETQLATITPALATVYENTEYTPTVGTAYQECYSLFATPENPTMGDGYHRVLGIFQVNLFYPLLAGPGTAYARAELIKAAFPRGSSFTSGAVTVIVDRTPEIGNGRIEGDRYMLPVKIPFFANIT